MSGTKIHSVSLRYSPFQGILLFRPFHSSASPGLFYKKDFRHRRKSSVIIHFVIPDSGLPLSEHYLNGEYHLC